jgi:5'-nucleotidase (lipoprotein e(P4) family)
MIRKWQAMLLVAMFAVACRSSAPVAVVPLTPPAGPVWRQQLAQQSADAVIYQNTSAEIHRLYAQCYELARIRLLENLRIPDERPPAVITDIDETVLDNSPYQIRCAAQGLTYAPDTWEQWVLMGAAKALPGSLEFLRFAQQQGCEVFYISNRSATEKNATIKNLYELGFPNADEAHVMCMDATSDKTERRGRVAKGHRVVLLLGDQLRDLDERFKDRTTDYGRNVLTTMQDTLEHYFIMLPNVMYGTWMDAVAGKVDSLKTEKKAAFFKANSY